MHLGIYSKNRKAALIIVGAVMTIFTIVLALLLPAVVAGDKEQARRERVAQAGRWEEMGQGSASGAGISANMGESRSPALAITPNGSTFAAWDDDSSNNWEIYVRRWNGSAWVEMGSGSASGGGVSDTSGNSWFPSLAVGADGNPIVAWEDDSAGNPEIYVRRWNGSSWVEIGSGSASQGGISNNAGLSIEPSLAVGADGNPLVAWEDDSSGTPQIYIRRWNGKAWVEIGSGSASGGGISNNDGFSNSASLAVDQEGRSLVAWNDDSSDNDEIYVRRWNGTSWAEVGGGSASGGGISNNLGSSLNAALAIGEEGQPIVAWDDDSSGNGEIYVRRWNGSSWAEIGSGSASGAGISKNNGNSWIPALAIDGDGHPIIAWENDSGTGAEIYVRGWNGAQWVEIGRGSAAGRGVSNSNGLSLFPALAVGPGNIPVVTWEQNSGEVWNIYLRRWSPDATLGTFPVYLPIMIK